MNYEYSRILYQEWYNSLSQEQKDRLEQNEKRRKEKNRKELTQSIGMLLTIQNIIMSAYGKAAYSKYNGIYDKSGFPKDLL